MSQTQQADAGAAQISADWADAEFQQGFPTMIAPLEENLTTREATERTAATEAVATEPFLPDLVNAARAIPPVWQTHFTQAANISRDRRYTDAGKADMTAQSKQRAEAEEAKHRATAERIDAALARKAGTPGWRSDPRADWWNEIQAVQNSYPIKTPTALLRDAAAKLRIVQDPTTPPERAFKERLILENAYEPMLERRATAPEKFAKNLQPQAEQLLNLVRRELRLSRGEVHHETITHLRQQLAAQFQSVIQAARKGQADAYMLRVLAPTFFSESTPGR